MNAPDHKADAPCVRHACKRREVEMRAEIEKLRQRCGELEANDRRYRWLRDESLGQWQHPIVVQQHKFESLGTMRYIGPLIGDEPCSSTFFASYGP